MKNTKIRFIVYSATIAAMYVVLTYISSLLGLSSQVIQCRFSEALTVLPAFTFAAVPGLTIGCLISNILTGCIPLDIVFGTLATLIGAVVTYMLRKYKYLAPIPAILSNTVIIPFVLKYAYGVGDAMWFIFITVFTGEVISCGILGTLLTILIRKTKLEKILCDVKVQQNKNEEKEEAKRKLRDKIAFWTSIALIILVCVYLVAFAWIRW